MTSVWDQETVCTKQHEWQSSNTDRSLSVLPSVLASFTWLFLPVRGHNERFLAGPIVPIRSVSSVPAASLLGVHSCVHKLPGIYFFTIFPGNVSNVVRRLQISLIGSNYSCGFLATSGKYFFQFFTGEFFYTSFLRGEHKAVKIHADLHARARARARYADNVPGQRFSRCMCVYGCAAR